MEINQKNFKQCDMCKDKEAISLCPQCFSYYCDVCHKAVHENTKNSQHKKEKIDYNVPIDTRCPEHEKIVINLFCVDEKGNIYYYIIFYSFMLCLLSLFKSP